MLWLVLARGKALFRAPDDLKKKKRTDLGKVLNGSLCCPRTAESTLEMTRQLSSSLYSTIKILENSISAFSVAELVDPCCQVFCFFFLISLQFQEVLKATTTYKDSIKT